MRTLVVDVRDGRPDGRPEVWQEWTRPAGRALAVHRTGASVRVDAESSPCGVAMVRKTYLYPTARDRRRGFLRNTFLAPSRARAEAANLERLARLGLNPPLVLAWGERRRAGVLHECFLATRALPGTDLARALPELGAAQRRQVARTLGTLVGRLHRAGFVHRDLHLRNLVWDGGSVAVIDCPRGSFPPPWAKSPGRERDLRELAADLAPWLSPRAALLFSRRYLRALHPEGLPPADARQAARWCRARKWPAPR